MMALERLTSVINNSVNAQDNDRAFTFIEFVKLYGFDKSETVFLGDYKDYLTAWAAKKNENTTQSDEEFVREKLYDILKSITLTYSSYEEQQYIGSIDWTNIEQIKQVIPLYVRKIREVCEFYRTKRNEAFLIVEKNKRKGSTKSIEQIIYDKIIDFLFDNKNLQPQMTELAKDLHVSVENFVDTFSEYFDIPRNEEYRINEYREPMITANMNDVDYRNYIAINTVINEIIYSGDVYLEELPLIANLGLDFSQECVGDMLALKDTLVANATIDLVPISEKIAIKRKLYEKFLGCDLYYIYCDDAKNVTMDLLVKASNPSGNLLNCGNPDTAVVPSKQLELLTHIGLFFKPDKISILKVNAHTYTWEIDSSKLIPDTVYVFPDPDKYGDIGNNKDHDYPLIMEYRLDRDIRGVSSGLANHDPLSLFDEQAWSSYYSKQQDLFKVIDNKNYNYSFTDIADHGYIMCYQTDVFGNEFAVLKGYNEVWVDGKLDHIEVPSQHYPDFHTPEEEWERYHRLINGGYMEDPFNPGRWVTQDGKQVYVPGAPFNFDLVIQFNDLYRWTGIVMGTPPMFTPALLYDPLPFGEFGCSEGIKYVDHWLYTEREFENLLAQDDIVGDTNPTFETDIDNEGTPIVKVFKSFYDLQNEEGTVYIKNNSSLDTKPQTLPEVFDWLPEDVKQSKFVRFYLKKECLILESDKEFVFAPYTFDGKVFKNALGIRPLIRLSKVDYDAAMPLWVEKEGVFYLAFLEKFLYNKSAFIVTIYKFNPATYEISEVYSGWNSIPELKAQFDVLRKQYAIDFFYLTQKREVAQRYAATTANKVKIDAIIFSGQDNLENFEFAYEDSTDPGRVVFSYNSALNLFLLAYCINNNNGIPTIYEHKFRLSDEESLARSIRSSVYSFLGENNKSFSIYNETFASGVTSPRNEFFFVPN